MRKKSLAKVEAANLKHQRRLKVKKATIEVYNPNSTVTGPRNLRHQIGTMQKEDRMKNHKGFVDDEDMPEDEDEDDMDSSEYSYHERGRKISQKKRNQKGRNS